MSKIAVALGGNVGNTVVFFQKAIEMLSENGVSNIVLSPFFHTAPVDCPPDTPDFVNAALIAQTTLTPQELLKLCQKIEQALGRPSQHGFHTSRTVDLDIITYENVILNTPELTLPHPYATQRQFVLSPLAAIAPDWLIYGRTVQYWLQQLDN